MIILCLDFHSKKYKKEYSNDVIWKKVITPYVLFYSIPFLFNLNLSNISGFFGLYFSTFTLAFLCMAYHFPQNVCNNIYVLHSHCCMHLLLFIGLVCAFIGVDKVIGLK